MIPGIAGVASSVLPLITEAMKLGGELLKAISKKGDEGHQKDKIASEDTHSAQGPINIAVNNDTKNNNNNIPF